MKISLGTDHAGFHYKEKVKTLLVELGHEVKDFGTFSEEPVDYPLFIRPAAEAVVKGECDRGIVFGGSGNGEAIAANKVRGVRCALCWNEETARLSRQHNDANVLSMGERVIAEETALAIGRRADSRQPQAARLMNADLRAGRSRGLASRKSYRTQPPSRSRPFRELTVANQGGLFRRSTRQPARPRARGREKNGSRS